MTPLSVDLVLDALEGGKTDGGLGTKGALKGKITASVPPVLDGKGTIYLTLHTQLPPKGKVAGIQIPGADLSSPFAQEVYYLANLSPGQHYLRVFLDDDSSATLFKQEPDKDDLVHAKTIQVHVNAGVVNVHDVVLDKVQP